jgi:phenylalanyl-tRNA synthetase beta chain
MVRDELGILHLKGILEKLFISLGIDSYDFVKQQGSRVSVTVSGAEIGFMFVPQERILGSFDIKNKKVFLAELDLVKLLDCARVGRKFSGIPKYPSVTRDMSFIVKQGVSIKEITGVIKEKGAPLLLEAGVTDYYQGKQIPAGFRGLTISCVYRSSDRTLTEEEVSPLHKTVCGALEERFGIKFR